MERRLLKTVTVQNVYMLQYALILQVCLVCLCVGDRKHKRHRMKESFIFQIVQLLVFFHSQLLCSSYIYQ